MQGTSIARGVRARRRLEAALARPWVLAALIFTMAFGLFGFTTSNRYYGYESETVAVTEGLVKTGRFQIMRDSPLAVYGHPGKDGRTYGRAGFAQPVLQAPFYLVGWALDGLRDAPPEYRYRDLALRFYNPFVAALAAAAMFGIVLLTRRSIPWAIGIAAAFTFASIAWPYSKIGMDTTLMLGVVLSVLAALVAARSPRPAAWAAAGAAVGLPLRASHTACSWQRPRSSSCGNPGGRSRAGNESGAPPRSSV